MPQDDPGREGDYLFGEVAKGETGSTAWRLGVIASATICCVITVFAVSWFWPESTPYDDKVRDLERGMTRGEVEETLGKPGFVDEVPRYGDVLVYSEDGTDWVLLVGLKGEYKYELDKWCIQKSKDHKGKGRELDLSDFWPDEFRRYGHAPQTKCHSVR